MEFTELINQRVSVRNFDRNKPVEKEILIKILDAGRIAPSAANLQPWKFILVSSEEMLEKVRPCYHRQWFKEAPHILIVKGFKDEAWVRSYDGYNALETDLTIAMDHMILAAENEGVGTCWIAAFDPETLKNALSLKPNEYVFAITPLGYQSDDYIRSNKKSRKTLNEIVEFI